MQLDYCQSSVISRKHCFVKMSVRIASALIIITTVIGTALSSAGETFGPTEYCHRDTFNATCRSNSVIIITHARVGRMQMGHCVTHNLGFLGCGTDVTRIMTSKCTGRQHCEVAVQDTDIYDESPCPKDTTSYLEISYKCLAVASAVANRCQKPIEILARGRGKQSGFISTVVSEHLGLGSSRCPWQISVSPGQRINLTLFAYGPLLGGKTTNQETGHRDGRCTMIAIVKEHGSTNRDIPACNSQTSGVKLTSRSHTVTISLLYRNIQHDNGAFLLKYEAVGCPDLSNTGDSEVTLSKDGAVIKCPHNGKTWYLTCNGTSWIGQPGNCTQAVAQDESKMGKIFQDNNFPLALLVAVAIGVALGVFLGGLLLTAVAMHNKRKRLMRRPAESDGVYYDSKTHAHYCELNSLHHAHHGLHCHTHTRTADVTSTRSGDISETSESRDYFLKPDPDLFCTIDKTYDRNVHSDKPKYGVPQER